MYKTEYNLEEELSACPIIIEKIKSHEWYAQNMYAALCNNEFIKMETYPILKDDKWSCSWRYAGGIMARIRNEGDYMDWYCSGIMLGNDQYVTESIVTDEIKNDLLNIGWKVIDNDE